MNEMTRMWVMVGVSAAILTAVALMIVLLEGITFWSIMMIVPIVALVLIAIALALRSQKELKSGLPLQDERSMMLSMRAGYKSFYISMYLFLFMAIGFIALEDRGLEIPLSELMFAIVAIMGSIHIILSIYYSRKGRAAFP